MTGDSQKIEIAQAILEIILRFCDLTPEKWRVSLGKFMLNDDYFLLSLFLIKLSVYQWKYLIIIDSKSSALHFISLSIPDISIPYQLISDLLQFPVDPEIVQKVIHEKFANSGAVLSVFRIKTGKSLEEVSEHNALLTSK